MMISKKPESGPVFTFKPKSKKPSKNSVGLLLQRRRGLRLWLEPLENRWLPSPTVSISGPSDGVPGQPRAFMLSTTDTSPVDQSAGFTYQFDWGDGSTQTINAVLANGSGTVVTHAYTQDGSFMVSATATNMESAVSPPATQGIVISIAELQNDPVYAGQSLVVGGTPANDTILFTPGATGDVSVSRNGTAIGTFQLTTRLIAFGQAGDDDIEVDPSITFPAWLNGGDGNDTLRGGGGNKVLLGGMGDNNLQTATGFNLLIGGNGASHLVGGSGDDILVGGTTSLDNNEAALAVVMAEWTSADTYAVRVADIIGQSATTGLNGNDFLTPDVTVFYNGVKDIISGGGGQDWFLGRFLGNGTRDTITDRSATDIASNLAVSPSPQTIFGRVQSSGQWWAATATGASGFTTNPKVAATWNPAVTWVNVQTGDFNGDGRPDIIGRVLETGDWWVGLWNGSTFTTTKWGHWSPVVTWVDVAVSDFDGNGKADIIGRVAENGQWWVGLSNGSAFSTSLWNTWSAAVTWADSRVADLNGDGKDDIVGRVLQNGQWWAGLSTGSSFTTSLWAQWSSAVTWVDIQVADFNGDGKADIVGRFSQAGQWWAGLSSGSSFTTTLWGTWSPAVTWVDVHSGDFNGDGKADIVGRFSQAGQWWAGLSSGSSFTTALWGTWSPAVTWVNTKVEDFNRDGLDDITGRVLQNGQWWTGVSTSSSFNTSLWGSWSSAVSWADIGSEGSRPDPQILIQSVMTPHGPPGQGYPGTTITIHGSGFDNSGDWTVRFVNSSGVGVNAAVLDIKPTKLTVAVPAFIDPSTGALIPGNVVIHVLKDGQEQPPATPGVLNFYISPLPTTGPNGTSLPAGSVVAAYVNQMNGLIDAAIQNYQSLATSQGGKVDFSTLLSQLQAMKQQLATFGQNVTSIMNGTATSVDLGGLGNARFIANASSLGLADQLLYGHLLEGVGSAAQSGVQPADATDSVNQFMQQFLSLSTATSIQDFVKAFRQLTEAQIEIGTLGADLVPSNPGSQTVASAAIIGLMLYNPLQVSVGSQGGGNILATGAAGAADFDAATQSARQDYAQLAVNPDFQSLKQQTGNPPSALVLQNASDTNVTQLNTVAPQESILLEVPVLNVLAPKMVFSAIQGGPIPTAQSFTISNTGFSDTILNYSISGSAPWLALSSTAGALSGGQEANITVSVNTTGLAPGIYSVMLTITDPKASNSPQTFIVTLSLNPAFVNVLAGDFNGDSNGLFNGGKEDLAGRDQFGNWWVSLSPNPTLTGAAPPGPGVNSTRWTSWSPAVTWVDVKVGDFNGDGKDDIAGRDLSTGQWWVSASNGSNSFTNSLWSTWSPFVTWVDIQVADFNGDGTADIAGRVSSAGSSLGQWWVALSTATSFTSTLWATWSTSANWVDVNSGDFTGDGFADIAGRDLSTGQWWVSESNHLNAFITGLWATWSSVATWNVRVGDFNGDGKSDIVGRWVEVDQWYVGLSAGTSFTTTVWSSFLAPTVAWVDINVGDFNADGKSDIVARLRQTGEWYVFLSTGTAFNTTLWASFDPSLTIANIFVGDMNHDHLSDIFGLVNQTGQTFTAVSTGSAFTTNGGLG
jgi:hypothetical protein